MLTQLFVVVGVSLAISFLCSVLEAVLLSVSHSYVALLQNAGDRAGDILHAMKRKIDEPIAAILTLNTVAHTAGAALAGVIAGNVWEGNELAVGIFTTGLILAILVLSEIIPKTIGATFWKQLARPTAHLLRVLVVLTKPVLVPLGYLSRWIAPQRSGHATVSRDEIEVMAELGRRAGAIDEDEFHVMSNVMQLDEVAVSEVMTPRIDFVAVPLGATVAEAMDVMLDRGKLRLPVYEDSLDRIVGILLARDLWRAARDGDQDIRGIVRPAPFAPASKAVVELIQEMRANRNKMVIVVDEYGGTAGLVTLEDLIEEIVGEFHDEHETDEPAEFRVLADGRLVIWGGTPLKDVEDRLGIEFGEEFDTVGGYVFGALNRVGRIGDSVEAGEGRLRIVRMLRRRIEYLVFESPDGD